VTTLASIDVHYPALVVRLYDPTLLNIDIEQRCKPCCIRVLYVTTLVSIDVRYPALVVCFI
jgi:hypothetical protein